MARSASYWVVGAAAQGGTDDHYDEFIRAGFWKLFWADRDPQDLSAHARRQVNLSKQIKWGDYIAIKKKLGGKNDRGEIIIRAIGQVGKVKPNDKRKPVKWFATDLNKLITGTGWGGSIHGSFTLDDKNVREVFSLAGPNQETTIADDLMAIAEQKGIDKTTKKVLANARIGQGEFRTDVMNLWDNRCAVTGSRVLEAISASHIKPWRDASNSERLDSFNGLPLVASLHALLDAGLISFNQSGHVLVSSKLSAAERTIYRLSQPRRLRKRPVAETADYLDYHRTKVFRG